jgi:hypothetical protein
VKHILLIILFLLTCVEILDSQSLTDSNLPVVIINTDGGVPIVDDPRAMGSMKIIYRGPGERNYLTDQNNSQYLNYDGRIDIEIRGSSSQVTPKKQYGFTTRMADNVTNNNVSLLGMPEENDWILNGMVFDPALMRDFLCYNLSRQIGEYASRTAYCEVIINGSYKGLYLLQEKIKADDNRVNIIKIDENDNSLPQVSGGYITKADKTTGGDPVAWTMINPNGTTVDYIHELPKPENVTTAQHNYIQTQFLELVSTVARQDASFVNGYPSIIDIPSFINHMIISELSSNADSYQYSTFFHKDRNGKLRAGPIWDNDLTFGNDLFFWGYDRSKTNIWQFSNGDNEGSRFWKELYNDDRFKCYLSRRWDELTAPGKPLNPSVLRTFIDQTAEYISEAVARDDALWENTGNHSQQVEAIKAWLDNRIPWMNASLGPFAACSDPELPPLVITKIMYHPLTTIAFPDEDELEYLEITNNGNETVNLTGIYFAGTGFVFQFPAFSSVGPFESMIIAGDYNTFRMNYGFNPFGQFTRSLSNRSENLVLADAFGNVIDNVCYYDTIPWPDADGNGYYLKLPDPDLDNSDPSSWIASNDIITSDEYPPAAEMLKIYPNPVKDILRIESSEPIATINLIDIHGRVIKTMQSNNETFDFAVSQLPPGIYFIVIETGQKTTTRKIIKE